MRYELLKDELETTYVLVFERDEEVIQGLREFANERNLLAGYFTAIGALREVTLGFFDPDEKKYYTTPIREQVEVLSLIGNVAIHQDKPKIHAHIVVSKRDGTAHGGHLLEAYVRPTLEVVLTETPRHVQRFTDEETGLASIEAAHALNQ